MCTTDEIAKNGCYEINSSSIPGGIKETNEDEDSIIRHARDLYISDAIIHLRLLQ